MPIERESASRFTPAQVAALTHQLLDAADLCAIATVTPDNDAYVNTAYFAWGDGNGLEVVWISDPRATHSTNLLMNASTAVAVYDSHQRWSGPDRGIQLFGSTVEVAGEDEHDAQALYGRRFPDYDPADMARFSYYRFQPKRLKVFDETNLGSGIFVTAAVGDRGALTIERADAYHP